MKRTFAVAWALALFTIILPMTASAVNPPSHFGLAIGITCNTCHQANRTLGETKGLGPINRTSPNVFNNMCQSCHRTGDGFAKNKPMALVDTSSIFGDHSTGSFGNLRQTSHRWDGSDTNLAAGAQPPVQAAMTTNTNGVGNLRGRVGNQLACVRCHSPHLAGAPGAMLRMQNDQDQMCMDCHRSRNQQSHLAGTHPVNVNYNAVAGSFNKPPLNANPINPTSDLGAKLTSTGGNLVCTTCHGVHYTDSRSSTFDGASTAKGKGNYTNLSTGDGYQLRTDRRGAKVFSGSPDKLNICTNCHANKKSHNAKDQDVQCNDCHAAHVEYDPNDPTNTKGKNVYLIRRNVKKGGMPSTIYFRYTGSQREYRNAAGTGVCQGCHNVPEAGGKYPAEHDSGKASDCNKCHFHGSSVGSFSGACGACHGFPPTTAAIGGPNGLASPATGALAGAVGAHSAHVTTGLKMECNTCHAGYAARVMPNNTIDIGFEINGVNVPKFTNVLNTGTYNNTNPLSNGYVFTGSVAAGANQTCNNIYCHGATLTGGTNFNPSWVGGAGQVQCGTCHGATAAAPPTAGSHGRHAGLAAGQLQIPCASCHGLHADNSHVNGNVKWNFTGINGQYKTPSGRFYSMSGSTGRLAPSSNYGTCSTVYCHSNSGPNGTAKIYATPTWGGALLNCGSCHANMATIASGSPNGGHFKHASAGNVSGPGYDCSLCHTGYTASTTTTATHANQQVELNAVSTGYTKGATMPAGGAFGTCTNQCHGPQAPNLAWGGALFFDGTDHCSTCHSSTSAGAVTAGNPFYSTQYPGKQTLNTNRYVGAHTAHLTGTSALMGALDCTVCHGTVALKDVNHMNGTTNFVWSATATKAGLLSPSYDPVTGTCSNVYCHGNGLNDTTGTNRSPSWKTPFMPASISKAACGTCHGFPPPTAVHNTARTTLLTLNFPTVPIGGTCSCHPNINPAGNSYASIFVDKNAHINRVVDGSFACNSCHGYPPSNKTFVAGVGNWKDAGMESYSSSGGAHTVAAHVNPNALAAAGFANCTPCHNQNDHDMAAELKPSTNSIKVRIDSRIRFNNGIQPKYSSNKLDGNLHKAGTCSSVACHFQKSPKW